MKQLLAAVQSFRHDQFDKQFYSIAFGIIAYGIRLGKIEMFLSKKIGLVHKNAVMR